MAGNKEKIQFFILGILIGLIIAGSFFIFKLDDYFEKLKLYKNITKTFYLRADKDKSTYELKDSKQEQDSKDSSELKNEEEKKEKKKSEASKNKPESEDVQSKVIKEDSVSATNFNNDDMEAIVIQKDELISSSTLQIIDLNPMTAAEKMSDSLLQKVSGIRDDRIAVKKNIAVELWKSPLHYKGYKMSKNKLILYGFVASLEGIKIFKLDDSIYIKIAASVYKLDQTYDYKSYQHVDDALIITKLK